MADIKNPAEWIIEMLPQRGFEHEIEVFPGGAIRPELPLASGERVYGGYRKNMYFSPEAIFIPVKGQMRRLPWNIIKELGFAYPKGQYTWRLKTVDDKTYTYSFGDSGSPWNVHEVVQKMIECFGGWDREAMMPTPGHLRESVNRPDVAVSETAGHLVAPVVCPCGCNELELLYPGETAEVEQRPVAVTVEINGNFLLRLEARCTRCGTKHLLLDKDFHGWNGFVCHDEKQASLSRPPLKAWHCPSCKGTCHEMTVTICTEGKTFFEEETEGEFDSDRWPDGFGWFTLSTRCVNCGYEIEGLVDFETM